MASDINNRHVASFVALFLPFLAYSLINDDSLNLSDEDKKFVNNYIKLGWIFWLQIILVAILGIFSYFLVGPIGGIISFIYQILIIILIVYLFVMIFAIFSGKSINISFSTSDNIDSVSIQDLYYYIPGYNFYLWYRVLKNNLELDKKKKFLLKESVLLWFLIGISGYGIGILLFIFLIVRVVLLVFGIDILSKNWKIRLENVFKQNPEEIFAYIVGIFFYLLSILNKNYKVSYIYAVNMLKNKYGTLYKVDKIDLSYKNSDFYCILLQNIVVFFFIFLSVINLVFNWNYLFGFELGFYILVLFILISRYFVLWYNKFLIRIPFLDEICQLILFFIKKIVKPI